MSHDHVLLDRTDLCVATHFIALRKHTLDVISFREVYCADAPNLSNCQLVLEAVVDFWWKSVSRTLASERLCNRSIGGGGGEVIIKLKLTVCLNCPKSVVGIPAQYPIGKRNTSTRVERRTMKAEIAAPARVEGEPRLQQHQNAWKNYYVIVRIALKTTLQIISYDCKHGLDSFWLLLEMITYTVWFVSVIHGLDKLRPGFTQEKSWEFVLHVLNMLSICSLL